MPLPKLPGSIATITDLKKLDYNAIAHVTVLGYHFSGDGGGGVFDWNALSSQPEDDGVVFIPLSKPAKGRWIRRVTGPYNVKWFGAYGDWNAGTHTGHDDYNSLRSAAVALTLRKGGTLVFPPGVYKINQKKVVGPGGNGIEDITYENCDGLHLIGYGATVDVKGDFDRTADYQTSRKDKKGNKISVWQSYVSAVQPFVFKHCSNVTMQGFELNGNVDRMTRAKPSIDQGGCGIVCQVKQEMLPLH